MPQSALFSKALPAAGTHPEVKVRKDGVTQRYNVANAQPESVGHGSSESDDNRVKAALFQRAVDLGYRSLGEWLGADEQGFIAETKKVRKELNIGAREKRAKGAMAARSVQRGYRGAMDDGQNYVDTSGMTDLQARKAINQLAERPVERGNQRLFRATTRLPTGSVATFTSWTPEIETVMAYRDNPGFGGHYIETITAPNEGILDISDRRAGVDYVSLAQALGYDDPQDTAMQWKGNGWRYPWEESGEVKKRLAESEYSALRYFDDFPEFASTVVPLKAGVWGDAGTFRPDLGHLNKAIPPAKPAKSDDLHPAYRDAIRKKIADLAVMQRQIAATDRAIREAAKHRLEVVQHEIAIVSQKAYGDDNAGQRYRDLLTERGRLYRLLS